MALTRRQRGILAGAGVFSFAVPVALILATGQGGAPAAVDRPVRPITPPPIPPIAAIYERSLFAPAEAGDAAPADAPALVGIAGRLDRDAVALVRVSDGGSRSLALGESVDGWRLESLAIDAAFFTRGRERVRVAMASDDRPPADQ